MVANIIYVLVFVILAFVLTIAVKAITRGVEAKQVLNEEKKNLKSDNQNTNQNLEVINQIKQLKDLHDQGILNDDEFKKAKDKILK